MTGGSQASKSGHGASERGWASEHVVRAAVAGDAGALETLVASSHPHVHRFARSLCATPQDAEDAAQEALIILFRKIGTLRAAAALSSWLFRVVKNECMRRARLVLRPVPAFDQDGPSAEAALLMRLEAEQIVEAIVSLPADERAVLVLRDVQGYSGAATAQALGLSRAAMKSRLHRARLRVRETLSPGHQATVPGPGTDAEDRDV
jgi:RNA polymerase sigma factor (sigma-70 family)